MMAAFLQNLAKTRRSANNYFHRFLICLFYVSMCVLRKLEVGGGAGCLPRHLRLDKPIFQQSKQTRDLFENTDDIALGHARGADLSLESALNGVNTDYLHPGAAKYYREVGLLK